MTDLFKRYVNNFTIGELETAGAGATAGASEQPTDRQEGNSIDHRPPQRQQKDIDLSFVRLVNQKRAEERRRAEQERREQERKEKSIGNRTKKVLKRLFDL